MNEIYAIYDSKADYYQPFWVERNDSTAIRALQAALDKKDHPLRMNAGDYSLYHLGTYSPESGRIMAHGPRHVADAWSVLSQMEQAE